MRFLICVAFLVVLIQVRKMSQKHYVFILVRKICVHYRPEFMRVPTPKTPIDLKSLLLKNFLIIRVQEVAAASAATGRSSIKLSIR